MQWNDFLSVLNSLCVNLEQTGVAGGLLRCLCYVVIGQNTKSGFGGSLRLFNLSIGRY